jgi:diguanylate cyclase (GGDEF)-like protein
MRPTSRAPEIASRPDPPDAVAGDLVLRAIRTGAVAPGGPRDAHFTVAIGLSAMPLTATLGALAVLHIADLRDPARVAIVLLALAVVAVAWRSALTIRQAAALSGSRRSLTDDVTGLPNRHAFLQALEVAVADSATTTEGFAVLVLDLDEFEEFDDILGHHAGDALLAQLGARLAAAGAGRALVARLGHDEFAALVHRPTEGRKDERPLAVAAGLLRAVREPFPFEGTEVALDARIGTALYPEHAIDGRELLRMAAGAAMDKAERDAPTGQRPALVAQLRQ